MNIIMSNKTIKKGICLNVGNCDKANTKENITVQIGEDFICPDCGGELVEIKEPPFPPTWLKLVVGGIIVAGIAIAAYFLIFAGKDNPTEVRIESIALDKTNIEMFVGEIDTLKVSLTPAVADTKNLEWHSEDTRIATIENGVIKALAKGEVVISIKDTQGETSALCKIKVKTTPILPPQDGGEGGKTSVSVKGGGYIGQVKNGKPHGQGTLTYNNRTRISTRDMKERYAEAGQYIIGEFYEGELVQGKLFDKGNEPIESIILGRPR